MEDQKRHELQWYRDRQALKHSQASRATASARAQSILSSLGTRASNGASSAQTQDEKQDELAEFDRKIYTAQVSMENAMTSELKGLGVPFFGTRSELIAPDSNHADHSAPDSIATTLSVIAESELLALRRRMVQHLEDLYRD